MNNNNLWGIILGVIVILAVVGGIMWYRAEPEVTGDYDMGSNSKGQLYVGVTDATADIKNVNELSMEVKKVEIYNSTKGWVTVSADSKKYNLLALKNGNKVEFYAKSDLDAGKYERVRVTLGDITIKTKTKGDVKAYSAGAQVVMNMDVNVAANEATHITLDFLADKSLHTTTDGKFVFAPVVNAESRSNAQVAVSNDNVVTSIGGKVDSNASVGVDLSGSSRTNFNLTTGTDLKVDDSVSGTIKFMLGGQTFINTGAVQEEPASQSSNQNNTNSTNSYINADGTVNIGI